MKKVLLWSLLGLTLVSCKKDIQENFAVYDQTPYQIQLHNYTLTDAPLPQDNPLTQAKVELGRRLFYSKALSLDGSLSCGGCHQQKNGFSDTSRFSRGVDGALGDRQSMAIINMAWNSNGFFWDGRAELLRHQSLQPIENPVEMKEKLDQVVQKLRLNSSMPIAFARAFGTTEINTERMSLALEAFMLTLVSDDSKFDRFLAGKEQLTASELRGYNLFITEYNEFFPNESGADCFHCHGSTQFHLNNYHNNGLDFDNEFKDLGREKVTNDPKDRAKFKTPTLRNIAVTGPYMHDGRFKTLEEVVEHYNSGIKPSSTVDGALLATSNTGLMLDEQEKKDLVNFLKTLTDNRFLNNKAFSNPN